MKKIRPCVDLSQSEMNRYMGTVIVAPITSKVDSFKFSFPINNKKATGKLALNQIRAMDKMRITKIITGLDDITIFGIKPVLMELLIE